MSTITPDEIRRRWAEATRLHGKRGSLARRLAFALVDQMEADSVTEADLDHALSEPRPPRPAASAEMALLSEAMALGRVKFGNLDPSWNDLEARVVALGAKEAQS